MKGIDKRLEDLEKQAGIDSATTRVYFADDPPEPTDAELEQVRAELAEWEGERFGGKWVVIEGPGTIVFLPSNGREIVDQEVVE